MMVTVLMFGLNKQSAGLSGVTTNLSLLIFEKLAGIGIFDPKLGGDPVLYQHFFWFYSHPAVYIMVLPGFGVISELVSIHSRKNIFGYVYIAFSSVAIAVIGFLVWGHHMFVSGQSPFASLVFSAITFAVAVPTAIKIFSWVATLYKGSVAFTTPMVYAICFMFVFAIGGLTGLFLSTLATDIHLHDTYFVVAHFHYVMVGGTLFSFLGGLHHWWSKMFGRKYNETLGRIGAVMIFVGFNVTFFVQFILGSLGMPRRYHTYHTILKQDLPLWTQLHQISSYGSFFVGASLFLILGYLVYSLVAGEKTNDPNPWGGKSLEWETATPPDEHNFHEQPVAIHGPYDFDEIDYASEKGHVAK